MPLQVINGPIIEEGEALSDAVDVSKGELVRLTMPAAWTSAALTFQISSDGEGFNDLYNYDGGETQIVVAPGAGIIFPRDFLRGIGFIKFRSGTSNQPVPQPERREFSVAVDVGGTYVVDQPDPPAATKTTKARKTKKKKKRKQPTKLYYR
jgi:hypothetical protein